VPIEVGGQPVGVLSVESADVDAFDQEDLDFMTRLADHAATAIENARLYEQVKRANEAKSQFVSVVAHELKIPMTSIKGYARLLELGAAGVLDDSQKTFIQTITSNVERMNRLVSDLLDISRVETGRISLQMEALPIVTVIDETLSTTKGEIEARGLDLVLEVPDNLPLVWGDRTRLVQVLTNLVSNAYKYTPQGSITIKAGVSTAQLNGQEEPGEYVSCSVVDTGIGIAPEDQERLFRSQFTRFENAVDVAAGHGLGLWLTNRLVELQRGQIFFESQLNQGSTFGFLVPVADAQH
jgi:signal transduction histidine kinase